jgi:dynein heavy chain, axonemal
VEITSSRRVHSKTEFYLDELNSNTKKPMSLALFDYAIHHLLKILRVLRMQSGHMLLIGLGGSGRQSLVRLACHIRDQELHQYEITKSYTKEQWRESLQKLMVQTAVDAKESCLLLADHQMTK